MSRAERVLKKQIVHGVRRTARREYRFPPKKKIKQLIGYVLAYCLKKYDMDIFAFCAMPNHYHAELGDLEGNRKAFTQTFHSHLARALNTTQDKVHQALFDNRPPSETQALDPDSVLKNIVYIMMNPVRAGIVPKAKDYNGLIIGPNHWGKPQKFKRPKYFFRNKTKFPKHLSFTPKPPPGFDRCHARATVNKMIKKQQKTVRKQFISTGRKFLGNEKTSRRPIDESPTSSPGAFKPRPRYSFTRKETFIAAIISDGGFQSDYKSALKSFQAGDREVIFPVGTDLYRRRKMVDVEHDDGKDGWYRHYLPPPGVI